MIKIITEIPDWAADLPIAAKGRNGPRFCKVKPADAAPYPSAPYPFDGVEPLDENWNRFSEVLSRVVHNSAVAFEAHGHHDLPPENNNCEPIMRKANGDDRHDNYASGEERTGSITVTYIYRDAKGENYLRVERTTTKQFLQSHWENGNGWVYGNPPKVKIPYRLPELRAAPPDVPIFICEREKDADNVAALGFVATTNSGGAGK
jgi:hypothetical protein